jgi:hypothetical protein
MRMDEPGRTAALGLALVLACSIPAAAQTESPRPPQNPPPSQPAEPTQAQTRRPAYTSTADLTDVRPFKAWIEDAVTTEGVDIEPRLSWANGDFYNALYVDALTAVWVTQGVEVGGSLGIISFDPDVGDGSTSANDVTLYGRYVFDNVPKFATGLKFDIPVGDEDVGAGTFDFEVFGAYRQSLANGMDVHANVALESLERGFGADDRDNGIRIGGGIIAPLTTEVAALGELNIGTADDTFLLIGGADWELPPGGHLRGGLSLNLDNGSEDFRLFVSFAIPVY